MSASIEFSKEMLKDPGRAFGESWTQRTPLSELLNLQLLRSSCGQLDCGKIGKLPKEGD